jgi:hypothetical protein
MLTNRLRTPTCLALASLAATTWLSACGDSTTGFDDTPTGNGGASGWTFVPPGAGTQATGGVPAGGASNKGGSTGKAGSNSAGSGGTATKPPVTFKCGGKVPNQPIITSFEGYMGNLWQSPGNLDGGGYSYPDSLELAPGDFLGTSGTIDDYSGIGAWFSGCINGSKFDGVRLTASGSVGTGMQVQFFLITNRTKDVNEADGVGECVPEDPNDAWGSCRPPSVTLPITAAPTVHSIPWTAFAGGLPEDKTDGSDVIALQWSFEWVDANTSTPYEAELRIDDLAFYTDDDVGGGGAGSGGGAPAQGEAGGPAEPVGEGGQPPIQP